MVVYWIDVGDDMVVDDLYELVDEECLCFGDIVFGGGFFG